jgi:hypothetical protein
LGSLPRGVHRPLLKRRRYSSRMRPQTRKSARQAARKEIGVTHSIERVDHTIPKEEAVFAFGRAYIGMHISRFEGHNVRLAPMVFESPFVGYNDV